MPRRFAVALLVEMPEDQAEAFRLADEISRAGTTTFLVSGQARTVELVDVKVHSDAAELVPDWRTNG